MSQSKSHRRICSNGFLPYPGFPRRPVRECEVEIAIEYLKRFGDIRRMTKFAPHTGVLKRSAEIWSGKYLSLGALLTAALRLGIAVKKIPCSTHAWIGVYRGERVSPAHPAS
jgi:hypothetical protein